MSAAIVAVVLAAALLFVCCTGTSLVLARRQDARLAARAPGTLSYKWGYFLGYYGIIFGAVAAAVGAAMMKFGGVYRGWFPLAFIYLAAFAIASYGVLNRRKWGWVFQIPLSLNMGLWAFNAVYLSNRWRELT